MGHIFFFLRGGGGYLDVFFWKVDGFGDVPAGKVGLFMLLLRASWSLTLMFLLWTQFGFVRFSVLYVCLGFRLPNHANLFDKASWENSMCCFGQPANHAS